LVTFWTTYQSLVDDQGHMLEQKHWQEEFEDIPKG